MTSTTISNTTLLKRNPDMVAANIDGDVVMMGVEQGQYYGITGVGSRVWELLEEPISIDGITDIICREYETDPGTCQEDMSTFINGLLKIDLIEIVE
ncbi:PqqD family peptide modification chaperone [Halomonas alkalisoli]|uniref:PqqD family peptide modification chaperone n=1 Tax=Halomonas alkalisoli TaxID=2907158 RepID=UPI001F26C7C7|nr:PqqD family peptide modification chaperone [Halomonas alkalisoli]MCE9683127.1 PqqD family peptide modification chaperone [Halomonas alkalisoli]